MASITNVKICDGYDGLIKTSNNAAITATPVQLTDGLGNNLPIQVGTTTTCISQTLDLTQATVLGNSGAKGDKGDKGDKGNASTVAGPKGDKGNLGDPGAKGQKGEQGIQGVTGPTGPTGPLGPTGPAGANGDKGDKGDPGLASNGYYGSFYDNTDQVISAIGTPQVVQIANTTISNGVSLVGPKIVIANPGVYDMRVTLQISNPNNAIAQVKAWLRFNGVDYPNSAHYVSLAPRKSATEPFEVVTTFGFVGQSLAANDYVEIYWESDSSLVSLESVPGTGHPDSGSVYVNVSNVAEVVTGQKGQKGDPGTGGTAGLVPGSGLESMKSDSSLTPSSPAIASGDTSIALGIGAVASNIHTVAMSSSADATGERSIAIGSSALASGGDQGETIAIGASARATFDRSLAIGYVAHACEVNATALGSGVCANYPYWTTTRKLELCETVPLNYPDDAGAATGGVPVGGIYHTDGNMKIRQI